MHPLRRWSLLIFLSSLSCTIIKDEDITSSAEMAALKLKAFTIAQVTGKGNSNLESKVLYDSVINQTDVATNTKLTRKVAYSLPTLGSLKLKLRSGSTKATSFYIYYTDFKQPYTMAILEKDSLIEIYRFRYNSSKQLNKINTIINPVDNKPATIFTRDTLIYQTSPALLIKTLTRRVNGGSTDYLLNYNTHHNEYYVGFITGSGNGTQVINQGGQNGQNGGGNSACQDGGSTACADYQYQVQSGNSSMPYIIVSSYQPERALFNLDLRDSRGQGTGRETDTYYFHPLMILRGQLSFGEHLLVAYMIDWWVPGAASSTNTGTATEDVIFNFSYAN